MTLNNKTQTFVSVPTELFQIQMCQCQCFLWELRFCFWWHILFSVQTFTVPVLDPYGSLCVGILLKRNVFCVIRTVLKVKSGWGHTDDLDSCKPVSFHSASMFFSITCCPLLVSFLLYNTTSPVCPKMPPHTSDRIMDFYWLQILSNL